MQFSTKYNSFYIYFVPEPWHYLVGNISLLHRTRCGGVSAGLASRWDDTALSVQCRQRHTVHVDMEPGYMLSRKYC